MITFVKGHSSFPGVRDKHGAWSSEDRRLTQLVEVFGPFPKDFLVGGTKTKKFFDEDVKSIMVQATFINHRHTARLLHCRACGRALTVSYRKSPTSPPKQSMSLEEQEVGHLQGGGGV